MVSAKYGNRLKWFHVGGQKTLSPLGFRFCEFPHALAPQSKPTALVITGFRCGVIISSFFADNDAQILQNLILQDLS
ncbi:hypothetical protein QR685DRAFT_129039 [Neurospora intermedia]|uniref:Uncharacterized protein n=1 Tax=Neurospora intermedia TaxID=5142 RepID=A0ABR3D0K8_NEUIN